MSSFAPLTSLPVGLPPVAGGWAGARPAAVAGNVAEAFGFTGSGAQDARLLTVPSASGDSASQLQARFLACLFER
ncbi:MAG: hypothetical protein Q4G71_16815 [Pseudomonadota bacterium]|nr:hypothetical protein [Pseudomonadota bacterium]